MKFVIENLRSDMPLRISHAETFLLENADPGVRPRPEEQLHRALSSGQGLLITSSGAIVGISLIYQYDPGAAAKVSYEIGTMRVIEEGFGLQTFFAKFHLIEFSLADDETLGDIFAVVGKCTASQHNLIKHVGMSDWSPPDLLKLMRANAGVEFAPDKPVLLADGSAISKAFDDLRALHISDNLFRTPKGDGTIDVTMKWFSNELLDNGPQEY